MKKAVLLIDYLQDFISLDAPLSCGDSGLALDQDLPRILHTFYEDGDLIVTLSDAHPLNQAYHPESSLFPLHCIKGTEGQEIYGKTGAYLKGLDYPFLFHLEKDLYSGFSGTSLDLLLRRHGVTDLYLMGVCTDICILHNAIFAYHLGYSVHIVENGVASFNPEGEKFALHHIKTCLQGKLVRL